MEVVDKIWTKYLKLVTDILHVNSWDTQAFNSDCLSMFPMIKYIVQHIVS